MQEKDKSQFYCKQKENVAGNKTEHNKEVNRYAASWRNDQKVFLMLPQEIDNICFLNSFRNQKPPRNVKN